MWNKYVQMTLWDICKDAITSLVADIRKKLENRPV